MAPTCGASKKRKQACISAGDAVLSDGEDSEEYRPSKSKKTKVPAKKARKSKAKKADKTFPFLRLPAELRNRIYELALTGSNGVFISTMTRKLRQVVRVRTHRLGSSKPLKDNDLRPMLLLADKQVNSEASDYLYGQPLEFEDHHALQGFLVIIGLDNLKRLRHVSIERSTGGGSNSGALAMLTGATELRSLYLNYWFSGKGDPATTVWRALHYWFEAYGRTHGRKDAGVDIIRLHGSSFEPFYDPDEVEEEAKVLARKKRQAAFYARLRSLVKA